MKVATRYTFELNSYKWGMNFIVNSLGYNKHFDSWIKKDGNGRYHIKYEGGHSFSIHYDVNTVDGKHMTLPSVETLQREWKRITPAIKHFNIKYKKPVVKTPKKKKVAQVQNPPKSKKSKVEVLNHTEMKNQLEQLKKENKSSIIKILKNKLKKYLL